MLADDNVDQLCVLLASIPGAPAARAAEAIAAAAKTTTKPIHVGWSGRRAKSEEAYRLLEDARDRRDPDAGAAGRGGSAARRVRARPQAAAAAGQAPSRRRSRPASRCPRGRRRSTRSASKALLAAFGIASPREVMVPPGGDVAAAPATLTPPFAVKVAVEGHRPQERCRRRQARRRRPVPPWQRQSPRSLPTPARLSPAPRSTASLVAEMARGLEVLIGVVNDPAFGPCVALGLGGVLTEVLGDITYRVAPFDIETARDMIGELKGARLFKGYRGSPPADTEALARMLVDVATDGGGARTSACRTRHQSGVRTRRRSRCGRRRCAGGAQIAALDRRCRGRVPNDPRCRNPSRMD